MSNDRRDIHHRRLERKGDRRRITKTPATSALHVDCKMGQNGRRKINSGRKSDTHGQMERKCATLKSTTGWGNWERETESQERRSPNRNHSDLCIRYQEAAALATFKRRKKM
ncbi:MAG: hypothetical protein OXF76_11995 [Caldilineaceae bacterium]|nr:hypothetical protein [Caldilineaceae bacterium]